MKEKINILVIEDSEDDFELLLREIRKDFSIANTRRIEEAEELEKALNENSWDVILSDHTLPNFDATSALKQLRARDKILPFIIVSGTIGQEAAVNAMRLGANDYILKSDYSRLMPALRRELEESTRKKQQLETEEELNLSQKRYALLANNIQDLIALHKPDYTFIWVSPSSKKILGYASDELMGEILFDYIHPEDLDKDAFVNPFKGNASGTILRFNYRMKNKNGEYVNVESILQPVHENGNLTQIVSTTRDVTEQKLAYDLLAESEERYHRVIDSIAEGVVLYNDDGSIFGINNSALQILQCPDASFSELQKKVREKYENICVDHTPFPKSEQPPVVTRKTGKACKEVIMGLKSKTDSSNIIWLSINSVPFKDPLGNQSIVVTYSDISKQKQNEESIKAAAKELETLIDTANAPIFGIDWDGHINEWNQVSATITGFHKDEVLGKGLINEFILDGYKVAVTDLLKSALRGNSVTNYELPIYTRHGQVVTMLFNATPRKDINGKIVGVLGVGQDITELIQYRDKLEQRVAERTAKLNEALKKEKEVVAMKTKFVSMASHEFRTPLSTISFAADFLKRYHDKVSSEDRDKKLAKINEQVKHMTSLLDDVLIMGKSEAGKINLNTSKVNLNDFCKKLVEEVEYSDKKTHKIMLSLAVEESEVIADEKLLRNILINLLSNAIKFSPNHDKILFDVLYKKKILTFIVKDWGMGIAKEDQEKIFEAFHRTNNVGTIQGTGLGLAIVKKAVEIHGGEIEVDSKLNKGTRFKITIPIV